MKPRPKPPLPIQVVLTLREATPSAAQAAAWSAFWCKLVQMEAPAPVAQDRGDGGGDGGTEPPKQE